MSPWITAMAYVGIAATSLIAGSALTVLWYMLRRAVSR